MLNLINSIDAVSITQSVGNTKQKCNMFFRGSDYERAPHVDTYEGGMGSRAKENVVFRGSKKLPIEGWRMKVNEQGFSSDTRNYLLELSPEKIQQAFKRGVLDKFKGDEAGVRAYVGLEPKAYANLKKRGLDKGPYDPVAKAYYAQLPDPVFDNIQNRGVWSLTDADGKPFNHVETTSFAKLPSPQFDNIGKRDLTSKRNASNKPLSGSEIVELARLSDDVYRRYEEILPNAKYSDGNPMGIMQVISLAKEPTDNYNKARAKIEQDRLSDVLPFMD